MKKTLIILASLCLVSVGAANAQGAYFHEFENRLGIEQSMERVIEVTGNAEKEITPDEIYVQIVIDENDTKGKVSVDKMEQDMIAALKKIGVDIENDLKIGDMDSDLKKRFLRKDQARTSATYELKVSSAAMLGQAYQAMQDVGVTNLSVIRTDHSKIKEFEKEVRIEAMKNAKEVASTLAEAVGQEVGKAVYIADYNRNFVTRSAPMYAKMEMASDQMGGGYQTPLDFRKIKLSYSISAKFELK